MANHWWPGHASNQHAADETLLLFLNGEVDARQDKAISAHLRGCWECRSRCDRLKGAIAAFMDERRDYLAAVGSAAPGRQAFADRLRRTVEQSEHTAEARPRRFAAVRRAWWPLLAAAALAAASWQPVRNYYFGSTAPSTRVAQRPVAAAPAPSVAAPLRQMERPPAGAPLAPPAAPSVPVRLDGAELAAYLAVHETGLCRGNNIQVQRVAGEAIVVAGVAERAEQLAQLNAALAGVPFVQVRVGTPSDDLPPAAASGAPSLVLEPRPPLLADRLKEYFWRKSAPERVGADIAEYSSHTLRLAGTAHTEAQALRTLSGVFTLARLREMTPRERERLATAVDQHMHELLQSLTQLGQLLDRLDLGVPTRPAPQATAFAWEEAGVELERQADRIEYLIAGLFAGLDLRGTTAGAAWSELRGAHHRLESAVRSETAHNLWREEWARSMKLSK